MTTVPVTTAPGARGSWLRAGVWVLHLALPLLGLWLLLAQPRLDVVWEDHLWHFVIVVAAAAASFGVALQVRREARRRSDARLVLIALAFLSAAAFLFLHGLATPQVLFTGRTSGFVVAAPVGLTLAAVLAVWSSLPLSAQRMRRGSCASSAGCSAAWWRSSACGCSRRSCQGSRSASRSRPRAAA